MPLRRTLAAAVAGALALALVPATPEAVTPAPAIIPRIMMRTPGAPRFLRTASSVRIDGISGTSTAVYDLQNGRYYERIHAGLASREDGFDGIRRWSTDVTGMPLADDTLDGTLDARIWAQLSGRIGPERLAALPLPARPGYDRLRIRYSTLSGPVDVSVSQHSGLIATIDDFSGSVPTSTSLADYRLVDGITLPYGSRAHSEFSTTLETVTNARGLFTVPNGTFAMPAPPSDTALSGTTSVPFDFGSGQIVIPIRVNAGPVLHVLFDSGTTNYLTPAAARRLNLALSGSAKTGGFGAAVVPQTYTRADTLRIGNAEIRGVPFAVLDDGQSGTDGAIGCEVLMRFVVQFDFQHRVVNLANSVRQMANLGVALPIRTGSCQAEIDARLDGIAGNAGIDTGSAFALDIMTPFVRAHRLFERYHPSYKLGGAAIGGKTTEYYAVGNAFQFGPFTIPEPDLSLGVMDKGAYADPTEMANIGVPILERFTVTFDYRSHRMWLRQHRPLADIRLFRSWK